MAFSLALLLVAPGVWGQVTYTWNGATNQNWDESTNWTPSGPPGPLAYPVAGDTAIFNTAATVNISSDPTVDSLVITVAGDVTLTGGGTLTVSNDITVDGTLSTGANTLTVTGDTSGAGAWTAGTGTVTVGGNFSASHFSQTNGTLLLNGTTAAFNPGGPLSSLELDGAANVTLSGPVTVNGDLTITSGTLTLNADLTVTGDLTVGGTLSTGTNAITIGGTTTGAGTWTAGTGTVTVGGNFGASHFSQTNGTLLLNGTTAAFNPGGPLSSLEVGGAANVTLSGPVTVDDDLTITSGTLTLNADLTVTGDLTVGGTLSTGANAITIDGTTTGAGTWTAGTGTVTVGGNFGASHFSQTNGTLLLNGTTAAFNPGGPLSSLELDGAANVTLSGPVTVDDDLTITSGTLTLNADLTVTGDLTVGGTLSTGANAITVSNNVTGAGSWTGGTGAIDIDGDFSLATFTGGSGTVAIAGVFTGNDFTASSGNTYLSGSTVTFTTFYNNSGSLYLDGAGNQAFTTNNQVLNNLYVSTGTSEVTVTGVLTVGGILNIAANQTLTLSNTMSVIGNTTNNGTITGGTGTLTFNGTVTNNGSGVITGGNALMTFGDALVDTVTNNGTITAGPVATGSNAIIFAGNYAGSSGTLNGSVTTNPFIRFRGASTTIGTFTHNDDPVIFDGTVPQTFVPGGVNTYAAVTVDKTGGTFTVSMNPLECASLTLAGTTPGAMTFNQDLTVTGSFTNVEGSFDVNLYGTTTQMPGATFGTTGTVSLGNGGDTLTFGGGFTHINGDTALNGTLETTNDNVTINALALGGASVIDTDVGAGNITISGAITNATPQTLTLTAGAGDIETNGTIGTDALNLASLTTGTTGTTTLENRVYATGNVSITGNIVNIGTATPGTGGIDAGGTVTITHSGLLTIHDRTSDIDTANWDIVTNGGFTQNGTGAVNLSGDISAPGNNITFTAAPNLFGHVALSTGGGGGSIAFNHATTAVTRDATVRNLILTAGTGNIIVPGSIGIAVTPLGLVQINSTANVAGDATGTTSTGAIYAGSLVQNDGTGVSRFGAITAGTTVDIDVSTADVFITGIVSAPDGFSSTGTGAGSTFDNTGGTITTTDTDITINHTGAITIGAALSSGTGDIDIDSTGSTIGIGATVTTDTGAITVDADDTTTVSAAIRATGSGTIEFGNTGTGGLTLSVANPPAVAQTTGGNITFNRAITLTQNTLITTGGGAVGGDITFVAAASINGTFSLELEAGTGDAVLGSTVGTPVTPLTSLTVSSAALARLRDDITTNGADGIDVTATTINLDELIMTAGTDPGADIYLNGNVTLSSGLTSLYAVNEINVSGTVTGTVSGAQNLTVQTSTAATSAILFNGDVGTTATLLGAITIINGYDITFGGSVNAASITQTAGANSTTFTGNVNTTGAITITAATNVTFSGTVNAASITQTNGANSTTFAGDVTTTGAAGIDITATNIALDGLTMTAGTNPAADIALTGAVTLSTTTVGLTAQNAITVTGTVDGGVPFSATSTNAIEFRDPIGETDALGALTITGGDIILNGIGDNLGSGVTGAISVTSAGNVVLNGTSYRSGNTVNVTATGFVELNAADYHSTGAQTWTATTGGVRYLATANGTWSAGVGNTITCTGTNTDVYLDHNGQTLTLTSDLSCRNLYFYRGTLDCSGIDITTTANLVLFGTNYNPDDADWDGADTRHAYFGADTLAYYPDDGGYNLDGTFDTNPNAAFNNLTNATLTVRGNFYVNGTDMNAGAFTLNIPDNSASNPVFNTGNTVTANQWGIPYAVAFNMRVNDVTTNGGWVAAAMINLPETNNGVDAASTMAGETGGWQFARPEIRLAQTIYDDVIYIELDMPAENSNGEIAAALAMAVNNPDEGSLWTGTGTLEIEDVYSDPDCVTALANGDTDRFYVRTDSTVPVRTWNTDATGTGPGHEDSTDRDGNHQTIIPDLTGLKGLFRAANGKTMSRHYGTQNSTDFPSYTATEDRCRPVLVEARFGQELHDNDPATQRPYDAHNFIEFRWSEQVDIGDPVNGFAGGTEETVYGIKYKKASATFNDTTAFGGAITGSGPLTVSGYATFQAGRVQTGSRGTYVSPVPAANDPTVHALYREFSLTAGGTPADQPHRLRISIAGWSEETRVAYGTDWKWFWQGYIDDAQSPSGLVTVPATEFIRDRSPARNSIEGTNSIAAGYGASNYDKDPVEVTTTATGLYGTWDTTAPDFAGLKASSDDWATEPAEYELIPVSSAAGLVSRLEMHFFDNEVQYTAADNWRWLSRTGWYQTDPATIIHPAPESFGGSRPYSVAANTTGGGVRDASFTGASSAFRIRNNAEVITGAELPGFLTGVNAVFYNLTTSHVVADDPYMTVRIDDGVVSWPIANAQLELSYTAYDTGNPSGGFVTDLAGNRLGSTDYIRALDRTPPRITLSLAGANRRELYLVFSKNLSTGLDTEDGIRLDLHTPAGGLVTLTPTAVTSGPMSNRALLFTLPDAITADQLVHPDSAIRFVNYGTAPNQETGILEPVSAYSDNMGNYVSLAETHRVTDIAIDFLEVLYASDGVNTDGVFGEDEGALRVFDGSGRLLERNITVGTRLVSETSAPLALTMYFDAAPATNTLPDLFEDATGIALPFWLPTILPGFNSRGNTAARRTGTDQILDANRLLRNFVIPEADEEMNPGSRIEMLFRYGDLYCARLSDPEDITSLAPWSFSISETKRQRGGVTILNNVIDSNRREQTIIQVEVAKAGNIVVQVFTLDGNLVRVLERGRKGAGTYSYYWDGTNLGGRPVARGMYFVRVVGPDIDEIRKVMVVKE